MKSMEWPRLLSHQRLGKDKLQTPDPARSPFQQDFDRIVFSTAFRRLQDKTQVHPLSEHDFVHTRLTHSLETSCVGRSLGTAVGHALLRRKRDLGGLPASDIGAIVAAACLAHDIGNPPFGHSGEYAIRSWFTEWLARTPRAQAVLSDAQKRDIAHYEGNAQGFRLLARLQMATDLGGLRLTHATLGAFTKYPAPSPSMGQGPWGKKFGFFQSEADLFDVVARHLGLLPAHGGWCRHPLVFLVEAADDICYRLIDFEDGFRLGLISYEEIVRRFEKIIGEKKGGKPKEPEAQKERIGMLRSIAIGVLVSQLTKAFLDAERTILRGELHEPLIQRIGAKNHLQGIYDRSFDQVYATRRVLEIEAAGYEVLGGLLDLFADAAVSPARTKRQEKALQLLPGQFVHTDDSPYFRLLRILDFVSGMTDSYAVSLFKKIKGISLPGQ